MIINMNRETGKVEHTPGPNTIATAVRSENPLLMTTVLLQGMLQYAFSRRFNIREYLKQVTYGRFAEGAERGGDAGG